MLVPSGIGNEFDVKNNFFTLHYHLNGKVKREIINTQWIKGILLEKGNGEDDFLLTLRFISSPEASFVVDRLGVWQMGNAIGMNLFREFFEDDEEDD